MIIGTVLGGLATAGGGVGNVLGMNGNCWNGCESNIPINRYEMEQQREISDLKSQIALRDANVYGDQKLLELYKYVDGKFGIVEAEICAQRVHNQKTEDSFAIAMRDLGAVKNELTQKIHNEAEKRCCADNAIVNYVNATFYPKLVADVTAGTTTTAQTTFNPIPDCGCGCN